jgi:hypothetical protein
MPIVSLLPFLKEKIAACHQEKVNIGRSEWSAQRNNSCAYVSDSLFLSTVILKRNEC